MPLPVFDTLEDIPELFRPEYEEREGEATPGVKKWYSKDVAKLDTALKAERTRATNEEKERKRLAAENAELKRKQEAKDKNISDEELQRQREAEAALRKPLEDENTTLKAKLHKALVHDQALKLFLDNGGDPKNAERAIRDLEAQGRLDLSDADALVIKDAKGVVTTEDPVHFFKVTFADEADLYYLADGGSGGGARQSSTTATTAIGKTPDQIADAFNARREARGNALAKPVQKTAAV